LPFLLAGIGFGDREIRDFLVRQLSGRPGGAHRALLAASGDGGGREQAEQRRSNEVRNDETVPHGASIRMRDVSGWIGTHASKGSRAPQARTVPIFVGRLDAWGLSELHYAYLTPESRSQPFD